MDASVAVKWAVANEPWREHALALLQDAGTAGTVLIAPGLYLAEVDSVIRKRAYFASLTPTEVAQAYSILDVAPVIPVEMGSLRPRARSIAEQLNQRLVYDSLYAALAEARGCEFWTADEEFYKKARRSLPYVRLLPDYPVPPSSE